MATPRGGAGAALHRDRGTVGRRGRRRRRRRDRRRLRGVDVRADHASARLVEPDSRAGLSAGVAALVLGQAIAVLVIATAAAAFSVTRPADFRDAPVGDADTTHPLHPAAPRARHPVGDREPRRRRRAPRLDHRRRSRDGERRVRVEPRRPHRQPRAMAGRTTRRSWSGSATAGAHEEAVAPQHSKHPRWRAGGSRASERPRSGTRASGSLRRSTGSTSCPWRSSPAAVRPPTTIALGVQTAAELGVEVGDEVSLSSYYGTRDATVTATIVLPSIGPYELDRATTGSGALMSRSFLEAQVADLEAESGLPPGTFAETGLAAFVAIDLHEGVDADTFIDEIRDELRPWDLNGFEPFTCSEPVRPAAIADAASLATRAARSGRVLRRDDGRQPRDRDRRCHASARSRSGDHPRAGLL